MKNKECILETFVDGAWCTAATLVLTGSPASGCNAATELIYLTDYAVAHIGQKGAQALSATVPVSMELIYSWRTWPPFLVDLLPQGFGRQELAKRLGVPADSPESDWALLCHGAANPIGNLRVREAAIELQAKETTRKGFSEKEIAERSEDFIEYLASEGFYVAGSSGVQGEWPKVLLTQDRSGLWHLDHLLADEDAVRHCLVKFIKSEKPVFEQILKLERVYYDIAGHLGLHVHETIPRFVGSALFIDRFDRVCVAGEVKRIGQESLYSLAGKAGFSLKLSHNEACAAIAQYCTNPLEDIIEYVLRDVANVALGNKDNHGRNTAFQRLTDNTVCISPLFDFAPMFLHPEGIARTIRWSEQDNGSPNWESVAQQAAQHLEGNPVDRIREALADFAPKLALVPEILARYEIPSEILNRLTIGITAHVEKLEACRKVVSNG